MSSLPRPVSLQGLAGPELADSLRRADNPRRVEEKLHAAAHLRRRLACERLAQSRLGFCADLLQRAGCCLAHAEPGMVEISDELADALRLDLDGRLETALQEGNRLAPRRQHPERP